MVRIFTAKNSRVTWVDEESYGVLPPAGQSPSLRVFTYPGWVRSVDMPFRSGVQGVEDLEDPDKLFAAWYQGQVDVEGEMELNISSTTVLSYALKPWAAASKSKAVEIYHLLSGQVFAIYGLVPTGLRVEIEEGGLLTVRLPFIAQKVQKENSPIAEEYGTRPDPSSLVKFSDLSLYKDGSQLSDWIRLRVEVSYDVMRLRDANEKYPHDVEFQRNLQVTGEVTMPLDPDLAAEVSNLTEFTLELRGLPGTQKLTLSNCVWEELPAKADVGDLEAFFDYRFRALNATIS